MIQATTTLTFTDPDLLASRHRIGLEFVAVYASAPTSVGHLFRDSVHVSTKS
jgi:hypothetical protein